jgi:hypothetical protein
MTRLDLELRAVVVPDCEAAGLGDANVLQLAAFCADDGHVACYE